MELNPGDVVSVRKPFGPMPLVAVVLQSVPTSNAAVIIEIDLTTSDVRIDVAQALAKKVLIISVRTVSAVLGAMNADEFERLHVATRIQVTELRA
jgi:hypothetical protein